MRKHCLRKVNGMGMMILCRGREAKSPLVIEQAGVRIYTAEELCYYLYNNIYLIGNDFISDELIRFLKEETGDTVLAGRLEYLKKNHAGLAEMIVTILKSIDYYSIGEIEEIREILNTLNNQNVYERLKSRGDSYLFNKYFYHAIECYQQILEEYKGNDLPGAFLSGVYHNMGVAFARMYLYGEAAESFKEAYKIGQREETKKCYMAALWFANRNAGPINDDTTEEEYVLRREIETLMDNAAYQEEYKQLDAMDSLRKSGKMSEYHQALDDMTMKWKKDYEKYTGNRY